MALEIPNLDIRPRLITFAMREDFSFPISPGIGNPHLWMISEAGGKIRRYTKWMDVDLAEAAEFCKEGTVFSVHTKRVLAQMAHWHIIRGTSEAANWLRIFNGTRDACEAFYGDDKYLTFDDRRRFSMDLIASVLGVAWDPQSFTYEHLTPQAQAILLKLCQNIHSAH